MYEGLSQKGCIMGVKLRLYDDEDEVNNVENPLDANIVKVEVEEVQDELEEEIDYKAMYELLKVKNKKLKSKLKKLNNLNIE
jgi:hypothetical protein